MTLRAGSQLRIFYAAMVVCLAIGTFAVYEGNHKAYLVCKRTELIKKSVVNAAIRSKKGLPANAYFIEHPKELQKALQDNDKIIRQFRPQSCDPGFLGLF